MQEKPAAARAGLVDRIGWLRAELAVRQAGRPVALRDPGETQAWARGLAAHVESAREAIVEALRGYTTRPHAEDEIARAVHLLKALGADSRYFGGAVARGAGVMPRNQLLYSLVYMGLVPARFADRFLLRPPQAARPYMERLASILNVGTVSPNVDLYSGEYKTFFTSFARDADFVVFVGSGRTAQKVSNVLSGQELMLGSGHGHNPIVVFPGCDLAAVAHRVVRLALYNQGQDCSAPSAVLCPAEMGRELQDHLVAAMRKIEEHDASLAPWDRVVGPNTDGEHVSAVGRWLRAEQDRIVYGGAIDEDTQTISPTLIVRRLEEGPSYREWFAPVVVLQPFSSLGQLRGYFETREYEANAMYVTAFGSVDPEWRASLNPQLHPPSNILLDIDLHEHEVGDREYGGYGRWASFVSLAELRVSCPILPQRDLAELLIEPRLVSLPLAGLTCLDDKVEESARPRRPESMSTPRSSGASQIEQRRLRASWMRSLGQDPYPARVVRTKTNAEIQAAYADLPADAKADAEEAAVGRVTSIRNGGMFTDIFDGTGKLQLFVPVELAPSLQVLEQLDLGDFVAASGTVRRTRRGELTIDVRRMDLVSKALRPPPEKFHGLRDAELRQRKRHLDLIANEETRQRLLARSAMLASIRRFLSARRFVEVETPLLQPIYGGANARPFRTHHNTLGVDLFLRVAPELYLKRLLIGGLSDRIYEIGRNFRNEGVSTRHNPEFTMLELYMAYADEADMRRLLEEMLRAVAQDLFGSSAVQTASGPLDFAEPFERVNMVEIAGRAVGLRLRRGEDLPELRTRAAKLLGRPFEEESWGEIIEAVFEHEMDGKLVRPTHVEGFPADISPLAKASREDPAIAERFETYCLGMEIANAFSEQNDPSALREALVAQFRSAKRQGEFERQLDEDFLEAIEQGMPPAGGLGLGIDRLAMIFTGASSIREVIAFPISRPASD